MQCRKNFKMAMFQVNLFTVFYVLILNLHLKRNTNSPPIVHFRFVNVVFGNEKSKKEKWQSSQNLDLNPTCVLLTVIQACGVFCAP